MLTLEDTFLERSLTNEVKFRPNIYSVVMFNINPLNAELIPICYLLALLAYHFLHLSRIRVKL